MIRNHKVNISKSVLYLLLGIVFFSLSLWFFLGYGSKIFQYIPGYYANNQYNELNASKSDLILQNLEEFSAIDQLDLQIFELGLSVEDVVAKKQIGDQMLEKFDLIESNINKMLELDDQMLEMRLPPSVLRYLELIKEYDQSRLRSIRKNIELISARNLQYEFDIERLLFDTCLEGVDFSGSDIDIYNSLQTCNSKFVNIKNHITVMEQASDVELTNLRAYINELESQWVANANFYKALSEGDYDESQRQDDLFAESRRNINEMDVDSILNEYKTLAIDVLIDEFYEMSEEEQDLAEQAANWYEDKLNK